MFGAKFAKMSGYLAICFPFLVSWILGETTSSDSLNDPLGLPYGEQCSVGEFKCAADLQCIDKYLVCDGIQDCQDGSDETRDLCLDRPCSRSREPLAEVHGVEAFLEFSRFRCAYGACIPSLFTCDGVKNCRDGSDESEEICKLKKCRRTEFQCNYGACINRMFRCNGRIDCFDGSDETQKLCSTIRSRCRPRYFQCDYGGCIFGAKKCNGRLDCPDGSDEAPQLCSKQIQGGRRNHTGIFETLHPSPPLTQSIDTHITTISSIQMLTKAASTTTEHNLRRPTFNTSTITRMPSLIFPPLFPSTSLPNLTKNKCSESECLCPTPLQFCVPCLPGTDVSLSCKIILKERRVCSKDMARKGHLQIISCGYFDSHEKVTETSVRSHSRGACGTKTGVPSTTLALVDCWLKPSELLRCEHDGRWYSENPPRQPPMEKLCQTSHLNSDVCGVLPSERRDSMRFSWPFLVSILNLGEFLCYGTLVERQWVLTTASCVDGFQEEQRNAGSHHLLVQLSDGETKKKISAIHRHPHYRTGSHHNSDLCLLKLNEPVFQIYLIPACLKQIQHDDNGVFAVTLMAESEKSSKWKMVAQIMDKSCFESHNSCSSELNPKQQLCGKPINPSASNSGTSGAPFLVNSGTERDEKWTLVGVFSPIQQTPGCSSWQVFVSVSHHFGWIQDCIEHKQCRLRT